MGLVVQKYGGTSVGDVEKIKHVASRVKRARDMGNDVVVVVSAMAGETNRLVELCRQMMNRPDPREYDVVVSTGEQVVVGLLSMALKKSGQDAVSLLGHQVATERSRRVRAAVTLAWEGTEYLGEAVGADLARSRLETVAKATMAAIELILGDAIESDSGAALALDGVKLVEALDRKYVLVGVNAIYDRDIAALAGASAVEDTTEKAVILATLQATDRWVRGRI